MIAYKWIGPAIIRGLPCSRARLITLGYVQHFGFTEHEMENWVNAGIFVKRDLPENYDGPLSIQELNLFLENPKITSAEKDALTEKFTNYLDEHIVVQPEQETENLSSDANLEPTAAKNLGEKASGDVSHTSEVDAHA